MELLDFFSPIFDATKACETSASEHNRDFPLKLCAFQIKTT